MEDARDEVLSRVGVGRASPSEPRGFGVDVDEDEVLLVVRVRFVGGANGSRLADDACDW